MLIYQNKLTGETKLNLQKIEFNEFIHVDSWEKLVKEINHPNLLYAPVEDIHRVFATIISRPKENFIVVSGSSDIGLEYQAENPVNNDLRKVSQFVRYDEIEKKKGYVNLNIPAAHYQNCRVEDKISAKIYAFTYFTFNPEDLPPNLTKWYCTNCNVVEDRISWIPFGVNNDGPGSRLIPEVWGRKKKYKLYVNLQDNTGERVRLKSYFGSFVDKQWDFRQALRSEASIWLYGDLLFRDRANLPVQQYLNEMAESDFILSPRGNGLDCYRYLESIYAGSIPILEESLFTKNFVAAGLPVVLVNDFYQINPQVLGSIKEKMSQSSFNYDAVRLSYWREKLRADLTKLAV